MNTLAESNLPASPSEFEVGLANNSGAEQEALRTMKQSLDRAPPDERTRILEFLAEAAKARSLRWTAKGAPWSDTAVNEILSLAFIDPDRFFGDDTHFQELILAHLPHTIDPEVPRGLQLRLLQTLAKVSQMRANTLEAIALKGGFAVRESGDRELLTNPADWEIDDDGLSPISSLLFSMPASMFAREDCQGLLDSVQHHSPNTDLLVLTDATGLGGPRTRIATPWMTGLTPWLRDPFLVARDSGNRLTLLSRTLHQSGREADRLTGRQIVSAAPEAWDQALGPVHWSDVSFPFHGGQLLFTPGTVWVSVHSLEWRLLQILETERIDPSQLSSPEGWADFVRAVNQAADELSTLCHREVRFVHPWPTPPPDMSHRDYVDSLAGGNDLDLDTLIAILAHPDGLTLVVGDIAQGSTIAASTSNPSWNAFAKKTGIDLGANALRNGLIAAQTSKRVIGIQRFIDLVESHFSNQGLSTRRTPLLMVPTAFITRNPRLSANQPHDWFPLGYSNVVIESIPNSEQPLRAQVFSTGLPEFDQTAKKTYEEIGCSLILHPPLMESLICEGGFRCATQQVRRRSN